ncbi:MAG: FAD-binding oxidoreductase [Ktedonobacteraceae bacterium]|nr:FAD-binding oxidoreductase [Ktedonobacteraceae bacterium]
MQTSALQTALASLISEREYVRAAQESDAVMGVQPQCVVEPGSEEEVAAVLSFADREGLKVLVRGGGTQFGLGLPPTGGDILLCTTRLNRLIEHAPHDLIVSVQAGMSLADLQFTLASARQWLALDPMLNPGATIGGLIATNASGARRLRYGGVRDQIIGIRVVLPDGTIAKGGGKVVKNVAGYDLPKLYTGSLGTLGVIVSANFRLYPLPVASRTVTLTTHDLEPAGALVQRVLASPLVPTIIDLLGSADRQQPYTVAVRFEMGRQAVEDQASALLAMAGDLKQEARILQDGAEEQFWSQIGQPIATPDTVLLKASLLMTDVVPWLQRLQAIAQQAGLAVSWRAHAGHGLIFARLSGESDALITTIETMREAAVARQGSLVVLDAPLPLLQRIDVWGPVPALEVMRRLKARFDPHATLNPGRFVGGI